MKNEYYLENGLRRIGKYDKMIYYAYAGEGSTFDMRVRLDLKHNVDTGRLSDAVNESLKYFPELAVRPVIYNGDVWYEHNDLPAVTVVDDGREYYFGSDGENGTNGYMFAVMCGKKHITFSWFHGLTDARGGTAFICTILFLYLKKKVPFVTLGSTALKKVGMRLDTSVFDAMDDEERFDAAAKFADAGAEGSQENAPDFFRLPPEEYKSERNGCYFFNIDMDNRVLVDMTKEMGTSFAPLLASIVADAVRIAYDTGDSAVAVSNSIDPRRMFSTTSLSNMAVTYPLFVEKDDFDLPLKDRCRKLRSVMDSQISRQNISSSFAQFCSTSDSFLEMGGVIEANRRLTAEAGELTPYTIAMAYPGRIRSNPVSNLLIKKLTPGMVTQARGISIYAHKDVMTVQVCQKSPDPLLADAVEAAFRARGIKTSRGPLEFVTQNNRVYERIKNLDQNR